VSLTAAVTGAVVLLAACGTASPSAGAGGAAGAFSPATPGVLTVATAEIPVPGFWEGPAAAPDGGFEHDLARALADRFGLASVRVVQVPFDRLAGGDLGGADLALSQLTRTEARAQRLDFSVRYLPATPSALVRAGTQVPDLNAAQQLRWAVHQGTTLDADLSNLIKPIPPPLRAPDQAGAVAALEQGSVDAVLLDLPVALALAYRSSGRLAVVAQLATDDSIAAALPKGSTNLDAVDSAIRSFSSTGVLDNLAQRWLGTRLVDGTVNVPILRIGP
jgi:polar amino acid transport system substrate-binding protein